MSSSQYQNTTWSSPLDIPLGAYNNLPYEDFDNYFESQPCQTAPYSSLKRSRSQSTSPTSSDQTHRYLNTNASPSNACLISHIPSFLPSLARTRESSSPDFFPIPSGDSSHKRPASPFSTPLHIENDDSLFANITLLPLDPECFNVATNPQVPSLEPVVGHRTVSPSSKKRSLTNLEPDCPDNASEYASSNHKRPKLSIDSLQNQSDARTNVIDCGFDSSTRHLTSDVSPTYLHNTINDLHSSKVTSDMPDNFNVSIENDKAFIANIDPTLLQYKSLNQAATRLTPQVPELMAHLSSPSKKRLHTDDEVNVDRAPSNLYNKRRKISANDYQDPSPVTPLRHNNSVITDIKKNNYVPVSPCASRTKFYQTPNTFNHVSSSSIRISPVPATLPPVPAYVTAVQPDASKYNPAITYQTDLDVPSDANLYTAAESIISQNVSPRDSHSFSYLAPAECGNDTSGWTDDSKYLYNAGVFDAAPNPSVLDFAPPFSGLLQSGALYTSDAIIHTQAYANNATRSGVDICQHSSTTHVMSKTGHTANASMPKTCMPATRGASSAEHALTFHIYDPTSLSSPIPASQANTKRRGRQATPASYLWRKEINKDCVIYRCLYKGPAMPDGCMQGFRKSSRNLGRHMRLHAGIEEKMNIPDLEKIALNGLPDALRKQKATCSLNDKDLHQCSYFRQHGVRWSTMTWGRPDIISRKHGASDHPAYLQKNKKGKLKDVGIAA